MRLQVLTFAVKLALRRPDDVRVQSLASFVLEMARFDLSLDLRDRARFMTAMLGLATADEGVDEAALLALNAKAGQVSRCRQQHGRDFCLGHAHGAVYELRYRS